MNDQRQGDLLSRDPDDATPASHGADTPPASAASGAALLGRGLLPDDWMDELARIWASPAIGAMIDRRFFSFQRHGHSADADRARPLAELPRKARDYVVMALDDLLLDEGGPSRSPANAGHRAQALRRIATAGALLMAAHDAIRHAAELPPEFHQGESE